MQFIKLKLSAKYPSGMGEIFNTKLQNILLSTVAYRHMGVRTPHLVHSTPLDEVMFLSTPNDWIRIPDWSGHRV